MTYKLLVRGKKLSILFYRSLGPDQISNCDTPIQPAEKFELSDLYLRALYLIYGCRLAPETFQRRAI